MENFASDKYYKINAENSNLTLKIQINMFQF